MKRILEAEEIGEGIVRVRLEATKRRTLWMKVDRKRVAWDFVCMEERCPLYRNCFLLPSPLKRYPSFGEFCNHIFSDYPDLRDKLKIDYISQAVPIKIKREP